MYCIGVGMIGEGFLILLLYLRFNEFTDYWAWIVSLLTRLEEKNSNLTEIEIDEMLRLMSHI